MNEQQLRLEALEIALQTEGTKATTAEVLAAAEEILAWLKGETAAAPQRPN